MYILKEYSIHYTLRYRGFLTIPNLLNSIKYSKSSTVVRKINTMNKKL